MISANEHLEAVRELIGKTCPAHILDVGMGRGDYGRFLRSWNYKGRLTGVDIWPAYIQGKNCAASLNLIYYDDVIVVDAREPAGLFTVIEPDITFLFDVLEHMTKPEALAVLDDLQRASELVLVSVPTVLYEQGPLHGNPHEEHKHQWTVAEMMALPGAVLTHQGKTTSLFAFPTLKPQRTYRGSSRGGPRSA